MKWIVLLSIFCTAVSLSAEYPAPGVLLLDEKNLLIGNNGDGKLYRFDGKKITDTETLEESPLRALASDWKRYFAARGDVNGEIVVIDKNDLKILAVWPAGHYPSALALSHDVLYVANRFTGTVRAFSIVDGRELWCKPAGREPVALTVAQDGSKLYVSNLLPEGAAGKERQNAAITVLGLPDGNQITAIPLADGAQGVRGLTLSPDGNYLVASHVLSRYKLPTTQLDRGWINTNVISIITTRNDTLWATVWLDDMLRGGANPWGIAFSPDGAKLLVAHSGTQELSVIDWEKLLQKLETQSPENRLSYLQGIRDRIPLPINGARALAADNDKAYIAGFFSDDIATVDLKTKKVSVSEPLPGSGSDIFRQGEAFFNDGRLCYQNWQSCASCHPDARVDGLNWDNLNDGIGNPKNTRSMLFTHQLPPVMTLGIRPNAEVAVRAGFRHIQFFEPSEEIATAVDEYLKQLKPVPSPFLTDDDELSESALRGKAIFEGEANCIACHPAPLYTDLQLRDVGTATGKDAGKPVRTPTLREVWRTAPYLHDGRAATIKEAITTFNPDDLHGKTSHLTEEQIDDLATYVESL